jgi:hypothetical protein
MWRNSIPAFSEIISNLNPLQILVLGKANWSNLLTHIEHVRIDEYWQSSKWMAFRSQQYISITHRRACRTVSGSPSQKEFLFEYSSAVRFNCAFYVDADKYPQALSLHHVSTLRPSGFGAS